MFIRIRVSRFSVVFVSIIGCSLKCSSVVFVGLCMVVLVMKCVVKVEVLNIIVLVLGRFSNLFVVCGRYLVYSLLCMNLV